MLSFHGYGLSNEHMKVLEQEFVDRYVIYSFDLFFHGKSFWEDPEKYPLTTDFWKSLLQEFLKQENIETFSLLGFSMGGKLALATLQSFPTNIESIYLLAPDGIKTSFWYNLATLPGIFSRFFKSLVKNPKPFFTLVQLLSRTPFFDPGLGRFAESQMQTEEQRKRIYFSWMVFRKLKPKLSLVASLINTHNIPFYLFLGKYDRVIPYENLKNFLDKLSHPNVHIAESGHTRLIEATAEFLKKNQDIRA